MIKHPLANCIERCLMHLGIAANKADFDSGTSYNCQVCAINLPAYVQGRASNLVRIEFQVSVVPTDSVGRLLTVLTAAMDMRCHHPLRLVARPIFKNQSNILLQFVCDSDAITELMVLDTLILGCEWVDVCREALSCHAVAAA